MRLLSAILAGALLSVPAMADPFPVVIEHKYGNTEVPAEPKRVVSLSFIGHDFLLALGVRPVALREWYGGHPHGVWPWGQEALGDAEPVAMFGEINVELVALMDPDLIMGQWSGMTRADYELLSRIAPTIPPTEGTGEYGSSWQTMLRVAALATGHEQTAEQIIADLDDRFAAIRAAHPEWEGRTAVMGWGAGAVSAYSEQDLRGQFLKDLGFRIPDAVNAMSSERQFYIPMHDESLDPMDADILIWLDAGGAVDLIASNPLRPTTKAYREGREVYAAPNLAAALSHSSPLSLNYALDALVPLLEQAVDGDPATPVTSTVAAGLAP